MWKHNSKGLNSIGEYDYYLYEEEWRNPVKMNREPVTETRETSEDTLAAEMVSEEERRRSEKSDYKRSLFSQLSRQEVQHLHDNYEIDFEMFGYDIQEFLEYAS